MVCLIQKWFFSNLSFFVFKDNGLRETGLIDLSIEVLHSLLIQIQQYVSNDSSIIKIEQYEELLNLLRKGWEKLFIKNFIQ